MRKLEPYVSHVTHVTHSWVVAMATSPRHVQHALQKLFYVFSFGAVRDMFVANKLNVDLWNKYNNNSCYLYSWVRLSCKVINAESFGRFSEKRQRIFSKFVCATHFLKKVRPWFLSNTTSESEANFSGANFCRLSTAHNVLKSRI